MSVFLASLLISGLSVMISTAGAELVDHQTADDGERQSLVVVQGDHADQAECLVLANVVAESIDGGGGRQIVGLVQEGSDQVEERGWLGVSIGSISGCKAEELELDGPGTVILNVVKDSPADLAGLKEHDVILSIGGEETNSNIGRVVELISTRRPGDEVEIVVLREGAEKSFSVELGSRAQIKEFQWKFELEPLGEMKEKIRAHLRILRPDEEGELVFEELGDLDDLEILRNLPHDLRALIPEPDERTLQVWVDKDQKQIKKIIRKTDGRSLEVEQEDGGEIVVRRTDEQGEETVSTYADEDALRAGDEEAYEAFTQSGHHMVFRFDLNSDEEFALPRFEFKVDSDKWRDAVDEWRGELEEHLTAARDAHGEAMRSVREAIQQWKSGEAPGLPPSVERLPEILSQLQREFELHPFAQARYSFHVDENGRIEARLRKGDSEVVRSFTSEEDLATRDPDLHERYRDLMAEDAANEPGR